MATGCNLILSTIFSFSILLNFPRLTISDGPCPYPCYPPPTGSGTPAVTTPPPPSPTQQTGSFPPPAGYYPSPAGSNTFNNPPPGSNFGSGPPPPDPILPYFPFYYRKPPHGTESSSATISCQSDVGHGVVKKSASGLEASSRHMTLTFLSSFLFSVLSVLFFH